jgi:hypothetical protein
VSSRHVDSARSLRPRRARLAGFALEHERSRLTGDEAVRDLAEFSNRALSGARERRYRLP